MRTLGECRGKADALKHALKNLHSKYKQKHQVQHSHEGLPVHVWFEVV
jgi:hypothetical protein